MSDIVFGGWSDTWRTDLGYALVRSPDIRPPPQTISYTCTYRHSSCITRLRSNVIGATLRKAREYGERLHSGITDHERKKKGTTLEVRGGQKNRFKICGAPNDLRCRKRPLSENYLSKNNGRNRIGIQVTWKGVLDRPLRISKWPCCPQLPVFCTAYEPRQ